jgi:hypothetical protein
MNNKVTRIILLARHHLRTSVAVIFRESFDDLQKTRGLQRS